MTDEAGESQGSGGEMLCNLLVVVLVRFSASKKTYFVEIVLYFLYEVSD